MSSSTSPKHKGFILDTNVLSLFAKVNRLHLLQQFSKIPLYITPFIQHELEVGLENGVSYLEDALQLVEAGHLQVIPPDKSDKLFMSKLPPKLGLGEAEAIALCHRRNLAFITRDRKAANYCERAGIGFIRLIDLLKQLESVGLLNAATIDKMLQ
jgi:predicted nucleic acid-binding protein